MTDDRPALHEAEPHVNGLAGRLNWLRAGVLGANDGIVSVAAIVVGVAGATPATGPILTAGLAGLVGGAISMALGEYVSVSSQSDSQRALIERSERSCGISRSRSCGNSPTSTKPRGCRAQRRKRWRRSSPRTTPSPLISRRN